METKKIDCPYCGANIDADIENRKMVYCTYCGKQISLENNSNETNINQKISITQNVNHRVTNDADILREKNRHKERIVIIPIICAILVIIVGGAVYLHSGKGVSENAVTAEKPDTLISNDNESGDNEERGNNTPKAEEMPTQNNIVKGEYSHSFLDHKQFSTYWIDGKYRCPNDIPNGQYAMLSIFTPFPYYLVSEDPNNMTWSQYAVYREFEIREEEYVNVGHGAILVPLEEIDEKNMQKYGLYEVGIDIPAGDYRLTSNTDYYESEIVHPVQGIKGGYQITQGSPAGELIQSNMIFSESEYITLKEGEYVAIINATLEQVK